MELDSVKPWTIKAIAVAARDLAINTARSEGTSTGLWVESAIYAKADATPSTSQAVPGEVKPSRRAQDLLLLSQAIAAVAPFLDPQKRDRLLGTLTARIREQLPAPARVPKALPVPSDRGVRGHATTGKEVAVAV